MKEEVVEKAASSKSSPKKDSKVDEKTPGDDAKEDEEKDSKVAASDAEAEDEKAS